MISGASGGLGMSLVRVFNQAGFRVIATDIKIPAPEFFGFNPGVMFIEADITDPVQISRLVKESKANETGIDILISAAGIYDTYPVTEADPAFFNRMMAVNLFGTVNMVQGFLNALISKQGRILVISSESYKIQALFQPYMITKASLEAYCLSARQELSLKGVRLVVIRPGAINTPLLDWMKAEIKQERYPVYSKEFLAGHAVSLKMVGKLTSPDLVADRVFKAATTHHPKRIYRIRNNPLLSIASILPAVFLEKIIRKKFSRLS